MEGSNENEIIGCIMSYRYDISSLTNDNLYCSDCIGTIAGRLADHHYTEENYEENYNLIIGILSRLFIRM